MSSDNKSYENIPSSINRCIRKIIAGYTINLEGIISQNPSPEFLLWIKDFMNKKRLSKRIIDYLFYNACVLSNNLESAKQYGKEIVFLSHLYQPKISFRKTIRNTFIFCLMKSAEADNRNIIL